MAASRDRGAGLPRGTTFHVPKARVSAHIFETVGQHLRFDIEVELFDIEVELFDIEVEPGQPCTPLPQAQPFSGSNPKAPGFFD